MNLIEDTIGLIDAAVLGYAEAVYESFAGDVAGTMRLMGILSIILIAANMSLQYVQMSASTAVVWLFRWGLITSIASSWTNFEWLYDILTDVPSEVAARLVDASPDAPDSLESAFDDLLEVITQYSEHAATQSGWLTMNLFSVLLAIIGALMACAIIVIIAIGKIGLAFSIAVAPVFLIAMFFQATNRIFENWAQWTIGFALVPVAAAGVLGTVLGVADQLHRRGPATDMTVIGEMLPFIVICLAAIFLTLAIPDIARGIAGSIVSVGTGIREATRLGSETRAAVQGAGQAASRSYAGSRWAAGKAASYLGGGQDLKAASGAQGAGPQQIAAGAGTSAAGQAQSRPPDQQPYSWRPEVVEENRKAREAKFREYDDAAERDR